MVVASADKDSAEKDAAEQENEAVKQEDEAGQSILHLTDCDGLEKKEPTYLTKYPSSYRL